ncbi:MAG: MATE family efflux transporter [Bacillota bacterium]
MKRGPQRDFTQGSIPRHILFFTLPMLAGNLLQMLYNVVDSIWVGQVIGPEALGAVSVSMPLIFALLSLVFGMTMATTTLVSQYRGAGDEVMVRKTIGTSLILLGFSGALVGLIGVVLRYPLLRMISTPPEIIDQSASYLGLFMGGILGLFLFNTLSAILRGLGDAQTPLKALAVSTSLNIVLDGVFILGVGPIPQMGVGGVALATIISQSVSAIWLVRWILRRTDLIRLERTYWQVDWDLARRIFKIGLPAGAQQVMVSFGMVTVTALINQFGPEVVAAFGAAQRLDHAAFLPSMSMGLAISAVVGQNLGAGKSERVSAAVLWGIGIAASITGLVTAVAVLNPTILMVLFTQDEGVLTEGSRYLRIMGWSYIPTAVLFILGGVMRGAGDTMAAMVLTLVALWGIRVPLAYFMAGSMGPTGIWTAILISMVMGMLLHWAYYLTGRWKRKVVVTSPPDSVGPPQIAGD